MVVGAVYYIQIRKRSKARKPCLPAGSQDGTSRPYLPPTSVTWARKHVHTLANTRAHAHGHAHGHALAHAHAIVANTSTTSKHFPSEQSLPLSLSFPQPLVLRPPLAI